MSLEPIPYVDVDGDGTVDVLVPTPEPGDCNHDAHFTLFLVRQGCGRAVGTFVGMPEPIERAGGGLPEITTTVEFGEQRDPRQPAQRVTVKRRYRFDGSTYREAQRSEGRSTCHHCSSVHCTVSPMPASPMPASPRPPAPPPPPSPPSPP